jgi:hypothetical protein
MDVSTPAKAEAVGFASWPGFDLWACHPDGRERAVEVKGRAARGEVLVSDNEWAKACTLRDRYWLYVVWDCGSAHPYAIPIPRGYATFVIGNSRLAGIFISNADLISGLAKISGLTLQAVHERELLPSKRYLPPPREVKHLSLSNRMATETVLTFSSTG